MHDKKIDSALERLLQKLVLYMGISISFKALLQ